MIPTFPTRQQRPSFGAILGQGLGEYLKGISSEKEKSKVLASELAGKKELLSHEYGLKGDLEREKELGKSFTDQILNKESYETVNKRFGKDTADLWKAATEGGKTKIIQYALENELRSDKINTQLGNTFEDIEKPTFKAVDYDKGLTPKERVARQNARYEKALPLIQASQNKLHSLDTIGEELGILEELSPQIGGWERLNIDPRSGDLLIPGFGSPESQQFVKTINDFTRQAKDSYGSRVTNFDLNQFLRRLPTLANSAEGRSRILQQMRIINNLYKMYEESLHTVFEEHGGVRNIDYDKAQAIAYKQFEKDSKPLKAKLKENTSADNREFKSIIEAKKKNAPIGQVLMMTKDGQFGYVPQTEVNKAMEDGLIIP